MFIELITRLLTRRRIYFKRMLWLLLILGLCNVLQSSAAASAAASVLQTFRHSKNCLKQLTSSSSSRLLTIDTTCYKVTSNLSN